jgi:F-box and WD-40 domain protein 1/11
MSQTYDFQPSQGLAPTRRTSLRFSQRPRTACGSVMDFAGTTLPRSRTSRWSLNPAVMSHDVYDWRLLNGHQEQSECAILSSGEPYSATQPNFEQSFENQDLRLSNHQRRASHLTFTFKQGLSELRSLGRRMSLTIRGKGKLREDSIEQSRPTNLMPFKSEEKMMDFAEAVSTRPRSRPWHIRTPSTRRRPSLPLLNAIQLQPWPVNDTPVETPLPRSRGHPVLSDLVYGGAGARASAAAQNERYQAHRETPLPPYEPRKETVTGDSESGIGIGLELQSSRGASSVRSHPVTQDPCDVLATELLENIFSYLDVGSLLQASLVSPRWHQLYQSHAVWKNVFIRDFAPKQPMPFWEGQVRHLPGMGKNRPGQDYQQLYKVRKQIDKRWADGEAAAIYLNGHKDSVYCVQFDESKIITGSRDNTIRVWDAHTYRCLRKLGPPNNHRERNHQERREVEPSGVVPFFRADITSPDPASTAIEAWHGASVLCLQYDDEILVTGSSDFTCLVWSIKDNYKPLFRLVGHTAGVLDVCIDKRFIITCSKDTSIKIWNRQTGQHMKTLVGHRGPVNAVQVRGNLLASASGDGMAKLWRLEDGQCIKEFQSQDRGLACVEFSEDGRTIFAGGNDKVIYEYDTVTGQRQRELKGHEDLVRSLHLDSANCRLISGSYDSSIKVWDAKRGETEDDGGLKINLEGWTSSWMLAAKSNYRKIVCTSQDGRVVIVDFGYDIEGVELVEA